MSATLFLGNSGYKYDESNTFDDAINNINDILNAGTICFNA